VLSSLNSKLLKKLTQAEERKSATIYPPNNNYISCNIYPQQKVFHFGRAKHNFYPSKKDSRE